MTKLSIIIPVYNVERYLSQCLESVINQTLDDIEIICINDCSTDGSLSILHNYANNDKRIKLIDLPQNQGVSVARNKGIEEATGDYLSFLDSDDCYELDMAEKTTSKLLQSESDIVLYGDYYFKDGKIFPEKLKQEKIERVINGENYKDYTSDFVNYVWDKVYKRSLITDNKIRFFENLHPTEDTLFALECFSHNPKITFMQDCLYNYRIGREGSVMNRHDILVNNQIAALKQMLGSEFYKNADSDFKEKCLDKIIGSLQDFQLYVMRKKCGTNNFPEIGKLLLYIQDKVPYELLKNNRGYKILVNFMKIHNREFR